MSTLHYFPDISVCSQYLTPFDLDQSFSLVITDKSIMGLSRTISY